MPGSEGALAGRGMLFSQMEPPPDREEDFHRWYDDRHVPSRLAVPGFRRAVRAEAVDGTTRYAVRYDLDDLGALDSEPYHRLKREPDPLTAEMLSIAQGFTRYTTLLVAESGEGAASGRGLVVSGVLAPVGDDRVERWLVGAVLPALVATGSIRVAQVHRRTGTCDGPQWSHLVVQELSVDAATLAADDLDRAFRAAEVAPPAKVTHIRYRPFRRTEAPPDPSA